MSIKDVIRSKVVQYRNTATLEKFIEESMRQIESASTLEEATKAKDRAVLALVDADKHEEVKEFMEFFVLACAQKGLGNRPAEPVPSIQPVFSGTTPASRPKREVLRESQEPMRPALSPNPVIAPAHVQEMPSTASAPAKLVKPQVERVQKEVVGRPLPEHFEMSTATNEELLAKLREKLQEVAGAEFAKLDEWRRKKSFGFTRVLLDNIFERSLALTREDFQGLVLLVKHAPFIISFRIRGMFCAQCPMDLLATLAWSSNDIAGKIFDKLNAIENFETSWNEKETKEVADNATLLANVYYFMAGDVAERVSFLDKLGKILATKNAPTELINLVEQFSDTLEKAYSLPSTPGKPEPQTPKRSRRKKGLPNEKFHRVDAHIGPEEAAAAAAAAGKPEDRKNPAIAEAFSKAKAKDKPKDTRPARRVADDGADKPDPDEPTSQAVTNELASQLIPKDSVH